MSDLWLPVPQRKPAPSFKWKFSCPKKWQDLTPTSDPNIRDCSHCKEQVHYVTSFSNFLESVEKGRCISVTETQDYKEMFAEHRQDETGPCVVKRAEEKRVEYQMPETLGRVDLVEDYEFPDRRMGRVVMRKPKEDK